MKRYRVKYSMAKIIERCKDYKASWSPFISFIYISEFRDLIAEIQINGTYILNLWICKLKVNLVKYDILKYYSFHVCQSISKVGSDFSDWTNMCEMDTKFNSDSKTWLLLVSYLHYSVLFGKKGERSCFSVHREIR